MGGFVGFSQEFAGAGAEEGEGDEDVAGARQRGDGRAGFVFRGGRVEFEGDGGHALDGTARGGCCCEGDVVGLEQRDEQGRRPACAEDEEGEFFHLEVER